MSQSKVHKVRVVNDAVGTFQRGATTKVYVDGNELKGVTFLKFEVKAGGMAKLTMELLADVELDSDIPLELRPSERLEKNIDPVIEDGEVTGYYSPRWVLGQYHPRKLEQIKK